MGCCLLEQLQWQSFLWFVCNHKHICLRQGLLFKDWRIILFFLKHLLKWYVFLWLFLSIFGKTRSGRGERGRERMREEEGGEERKGGWKRKQASAKKTKKGRKKKERRQAKQAAGAESEQVSFSLSFFCLLINHCSSFVTGLCYPQCPSKQLFFQPLFSWLPGKQECRLEPSVAQPAPL